MQHLPSINILVLLQFLEQFSDFLSLGNPDNDQLDRIVTVLVQADLCLPGRRLRSRERARPAERQLSVRSLSRRWTLQDQRSRPHVDYTMAFVLTKTNSEGLIPAAHSNNLLAALTAQGPLLVVNV